jgi:plasmid stabilization system protein ParE
MNFRVIVSPGAEKDLRRNTRWWAENHSPEQAARWYEYSSKALFSFCSLPERHARSVENDDFPFEIRDLLFGFGSRPSYRAVYTIQENTVYVIAVRYGSEDRLLPSDVDFTPE